MIATVLKTGDAEMLGAIGRLIGNILLEWHLDGNNCHGTYSPMATSS